LVYQGTCHGYALLFATGKGSWFVVQAVAEAQEFHEFHGLFLGFCSAGVLDKCRNADVFKGGKFRQQLVELEDKTDVFVSEPGQLPFFKTSDILSVDFDTAGYARVRGVQGSKNLEEGGFTRPRGPNHRYDFPFGDFQAHPFEDFYRAIGFMNVFSQDHRGILRG